MRKDDLTDLAVNFIRDDLDQRVDRIWYEALERGDTQFIHVDGTMDISLERTLNKYSDPVLRERMLREARQRVAARSASSNPVFYSPACSYDMTEQLVKTLEDRKERAVDDFPRRTGTQLEVISLRTEEYKELRKRGCRIKLGVYADRRNEMSLDRKVSNSFIMQFAMPDDSSVGFHTIDSEIDYLNRLGVKPVGQVPDMDKGLEVIKSLVKAECYKIRDDRGSAVARGAFELRRRLLLLMDEQPVLFYPTR